MIYKKLVLGKEQQYSCCITQIIQGKPLQYITNQQEFMKLNFYVDENVLVPRPDTEILVEEVIEIVKKQKKEQILDLCTGSGAIGISIAKYVASSNVVLADISKEALQVAKKNAKQNGVEKQITLIQSNLFEKIQTTFDIIVSNPPYIRSKVIKTLQKEVQQQPQIALDGGEDGIFFYRDIIKKAKQYLNPNGYLCLEIGYDQKESVIGLLEESNQYQEIENKKDLSENDRVIIAKVR